MTWLDPADPERTKYRTEYQCAAGHRVSTEHRSCPARCSRRQPDGSLRNEFCDERVYRVVIREVELSREAVDPR